MPRIAHAPAEDLLFGFAMVTPTLVGRVRCTAPVTSIQMELGLGHDGIIVAVTTGANSGVAALSKNVATPCVNGVYQGIADASVTFPPKFTPPAGFIYTLSAAVSITC